MQRSCCFQFNTIKSLIVNYLTKVKSYVLNVAVPPHVELSLGPAVNPRDLEEGDDVYFECHITAHPPAYKVTWKHNVRQYFLNFIKFYSRKYK